MNSVEVVKLKVVVVGAGIVGGFVSYYAIKASHEVTLVDISREAGRTSKSSAGFIVRASAPEPPESMLSINNLSRRSRVRLLIAKRNVQPSS
jgi:glycine/D-amino acid oxidase-like deaminating enzyme